MFEKLSRNVMIFGSIILYRIRHIMHATAVVHRNVKLMFLMTKMKLHQ